MFSLFALVLAGLVTSVSSVLDREVSTSSEERQWISLIQRLAVSRTLADAHTSPHPAMLSRTYKADLFINLTLSRNSTLSKNTRPIYGSSDSTGKRLSLGANGTLGVYPHLMPAHASRPTNALHMQALANRQALNVEDADVPNPQMPDVPDIDVPDVPDIDVPDVPDIDVPDPAPALDPRDRKNVEYSPTDEIFWWLCCCAAILVIFAGLMSGLSFALLSLTAIDLDVMCKSGDEQQKEDVEILREVVADPHALLVTLLLNNAAAMEILPLVLDDLVSHFFAVVLSITAVLAFGEIIPQAICRKYGVQIGVKSAPIVKLLMMVWWPVVFPIKSILDYTFNEHADDGANRRLQIATLLGVHKDRGELTEPEVVIMEGVLEIIGKSCKDCMTPYENVKFLEYDSKMDATTMDMIYETGFSRIPVLSKKASDACHIAGVIITKTLIAYRFDQPVPVSELYLWPTVNMPADTAVFKLLTIFQKGSCHMAAIFASEDIVGIERRPDGDLDHAPPGVAPIGIVTLEDVLEEILKAEIHDETEDAGLLTMLKTAARAKESIRRQISGIKISQRRATSVPLRANAR